MMPASPRCSSCPPSRDRQRARRGRLLLRPDDPCQRLAAGRRPCSSATSSTCRPSHRGTRPGCVSCVPSRASTECGRRLAERLGRHVFGCVRAPASAGRCTPIPARPASNRSLCSGSRRLAADAPPPDLRPEAGVVDGWLLRPNAPSGVEPWLEGAPVWIETPGGRITARPRPGRAPADRRPGRVVGREFDLGGREPPSPRRR